MLFIIPTPIGNLKDITLRSLETLKEVDGVICEDSRRTSLLLNHYQIRKPLFILNDYNEARQTPFFLNKLLQGEKLALVSDAGTPLISDPGYKLVRECLAQNIPVDSLPGPSSILIALTLSGLPPDKFLFLGYPPEKSGQRLKLFKSLGLHLEVFDPEAQTRRGVKLRYTAILFVAPHKLIRTLEDIMTTLGNIEVVLAKELTKIHQSVKKQKIDIWLEEFKKQSPKGEYIVLLSLT